MVATSVPKFRYKSLEDLPSVLHCNYQTVPIFYTSEELFQGIQETTNTRNTAAGTLTFQEVKLLRNMLIALNERPLLPWQNYCEQFSLEVLSQSVRESILMVVRKAYQFHEQENNTKGSATTSSISHSQSV